MPKPTVNDLYVLLVRMEERLISQGKQLDVAIKWQNSHQASDDSNYKEISNSLKRLDGLSMKVGVVFSCLGGVAVYLFKKFTGTNI